MSKFPTIRVASGSRDAPYSSVWRIVADKSGANVYLGWSKLTWSSIKLSLHESGIWRLAASEQSGVTYDETNNRLAQAFRRPQEHLPGVIRGPSILVPLTSLGSRSLFEADLEKEIHWYRAPRSSSELVEFSLYFLEPTASRKWHPDQTVVGSLPLTQGRELFVIAGSLPTPEKFNSTVEDFISKHVHPIADLSDWAGGHLIWSMESIDDKKTPLLVDIPMAAYVMRTGQRTARGTPGAGRQLNVGFFSRRLGIEDISCIVASPLARGA